MNDPVNGWVYKLIKRSSDLTDDNYSKILTEITILLNHNHQQSVCESLAPVISSMRYDNELSSYESHSKHLVVAIVIIVVCLHIVTLLIMLSPSPVVTKKILLPTIVGVLIHKPSTDLVKVSKSDNTIKSKPKPKQKKLAQPKKVPASDKAIALPEPVVDKPIVSDEFYETDLDDEPPKIQQAPIVSPRSDASHLNNRAPVYPRASLRRHEEGKVVLKLLIRADGTVGEVWVKESSGHGRLDKAALKAIKRWRYVPARQGDKTIDFWYQQPFVFSLKK